MKVLVVGGAGYIGSHVTRCLLDDGHSVSVYDNLSTGCKENLFPEATFFRGDILDYPALLNVMQTGYDAVVHLAALKAAGESMVVPQKYSLNNISGTLNLLNVCTECGTKNVVFSSSAAIYGEPKYLPIDENHPCAPENYYGFTKLEIERFLDWYSRLKPINFAALRYFNAAGYDLQGRIYGLERNPANLLPAVMEVAVGKKERIDIFGDDYDTPDGTGIRDYIHVTDLAKAHLMALNYIAQNSTNIKINLGSENGISVLEMVEMARQVTGKAVPARVVGRRAGDPARVVASSKMASSLLGWKALNSDTQSLIESTWKVYQKTL
ncbi:UDP-glucose 4-epimerase GalE [Chitinispirillales bacterium ANBcel5]|uniref:UDP-glucose 4-epimerase GalE n=1 Tax=Cellulosispirillum alkaliphilum TaxID=3039283 RepID=UPI002A5828CA|nr:UDP-glucose 4-epimerase GalE [Chitinispirillales bacterium ANBcel5]